MPDNRRDVLIDSKELLDKSGISRATLNNYIKLGLIPKPVVQKPLDSIKMAKRIGYFSKDVLDRIEKVKRLKRRGFPMEAISQKIKETMNVNEKAEEEKEEKLTIRSSMDHRREINFINDGGLKLTIESIDVPAYLINRRFEIEWINEAAEKTIFNKNIRAMKDAESRNLFKLFFTWDFNNAVKNWRDMIEFHMKLVKSSYPRDFIAKIYSEVSETNVDYLQAVYDNVTTTVPEKFNQSHLTLRRNDGKEESYRVFTTFFREGILILYSPSEGLLDGIAELLSHREVVINNLLQNRLPTLVHFCVLVADLQDSVRICAELPPKEYFALINQIYKTMEELFKKYYGIYGKHAGDGVIYYFLKEQNSNYILNSILCAIEVKEKMEKLSAEWRFHKKWYNDLFLNIGINEGQEYFSTINASTSVEFTALGDTINYASRLSGLARYGAIYTTKNLINNLREEDRKKFKFGIRRKTDEREVFIENMYSRVVDLLSGDEMRRSKFMDISTLPVTEIVK